MSLWSCFCVSLPIYNLHPVHECFDEHTPFLVVSHETVMLMTEICLSSTRHNNTITPLGLNGTFVERPFTRHSISVVHILFPPHTAPREATGRVHPAYSSLARARVYSFVHILYAFGKPRFPVPIGR